MWNLKRRYLNNVGFTLIEIILVFGISSMLILSIYSLINISTKSLEYIEEKDETYLYGRYIVEYIKNEVKQGDIIISSDKITNLDTKFPNNIGFVIMKDKGKDYDKNKEYRYNFSMFFLEGTSLIRNAHNNNDGIYPTASKFNNGGNNEIYDKVLSIKDTKIDYDKRVMELSISLGSDEDNASVFKSTVYLYNNMDY